MILLIDNYDSFAYNLYQMVGEIAKEIKVIRNDIYSVAQIAQLNPQAIILSPGPGRPEDAWSLPRSDYSPRTQNSDFRCLLRPSSYLPSFWCYDYPCPTINAWQVLLYSNQSGKSSI